MDQEFQKVLQEHLSRYPLMQPQDCVKLAYQSEFGPEHLIADKDSVLHSLREEWDALPIGNTPLPERIGNGLCRFYLTTAYNPVLASPLLADLFMWTAERQNGNQYQFLEKLSMMTRTDVVGMADYIKDYRARSCPPVRHSAIYRESYRPHYRLLRNEYSVFFSVLYRIAELLKSNASAVVAIDGNCGSGKSGLAELIQREFHCNVIHMDDYYCPAEERAPDWRSKPGGNMDFARLQKEVLSPIKQGASALYRPYSCKAHAFGKPELISGNALTVVEGSYSQHPLLTHYYDFKIFLTCSAEEQIRRLKLREGTAFQAFESCWIPLEDRYHQICAPEQKSNVVIDTSNLFIPYTSTAPGS